jgi:hypothetical protein
VMGEERMEETGGEDGGDWRRWEEIRGEVM